MKYYLSIFITLLLITSAYAEDQIHCAQEVSEPEVFKLLETVKNDILGTIPRFCRAGEYEQLSEQVDPGEKSLSHFVDQLRDLKIKDKDAFVVDEKNMDAILFHTIKLVSLKKLWALSSEDDQYTLLLSDECGDAGLNRLPLQSKNAKKSGKNFVNKDKLRLLCVATELRDVTPLMTKDILAESLLNIKKIFPESFPEITSRLCTHIASIDESILKDESYSRFLVGDESLSSAKEFSQWLQDTYKQVTITMDNLTPKAQLKQVLKMSKVDYEDKQNSLKEEFEKAHAEDKLNTPVPSKDDPTFFIKKLPNGAYAYILSPELKAKSDKNVAVSNKAAEVEGKELYTIAQINLKTLYESAQKTSPQKLVPFPDQEGFFVKKDKDGKYIYVMSESMKKKVKDQLSTEKEKKSTVEKIPGIDDPENQALLKYFYEIQKTEGKDAISSLSSPAIKKGKNGFYEYDNSAWNTGGLGGWADLITPTQVYVNELTKNAEDKVIPGMMGKDTLVVNENGKMNIIVITEATKEDKKPTSSADYSNLFSTDGTMGISMAIDMVIKDKYQNVSLLEKKVSELTPKEKAALVGYTGSEYREINECLRKDNCDDELKEKVTSINSTIKKLQTSNEGDLSQSKLLYRGTALPESIREELKKNPKGYMLDKGFISTSGSIETAKGFSGASSLQFMSLDEKIKEIDEKIAAVQGSPEIAIKLKAKIEKANSDSALFIIKARSCSGIANMSRSQGEDEFLCPPGMKFNVTAKKNSSNVFILEEVSEK